MKHLILSLLLIPTMAIAQNQAIYLKLTDPKGTPIIGTVMMKGFERSFEALTFSNQGKNNSQMTFTIQITNASAEIKRAMVSGEFLMNGQVTVTQSQPGSYGGPQTLYTIKLEKITVKNCNESMSCNSAMTTSVTLQASRIGWTYYSSDGTGKTTISNKYGYDNETGKPWDNF